METILALAILIIAILVVAGSKISSVFRKKTVANSPFPTKQSPYEKHLAEHATDWNIRWQRKELVRQKSLLNEALARGDTGSAKIRRSMILFSRSFINYLYQKLREANQK